MRVFLFVHEAVDKVRREEVKRNPLLLGACSIFLKNEKNLTVKRKAVCESLSLFRLNLKSMRALQIRETFQKIYATTSKEDFDAK